MFYLGIDQHRKQLTISLRDEQGSVVLRQQVSTCWDRVREFFARVRERCAGDGGFIAIVEVCGFNDWLLKLLVEYGCKEIVLIQPETRSKKKTDRRDANRLSELLWVNQQRLLAGEKVQGLRRVWIAPAEVRQDRQLAELRKRLAAQRTRVINHVSHILRKHNLQQDCPTKGIKTNPLTQENENEKNPARGDQMRLHRSFAVRRRTPTWRTSSRGHLDSPAACRSGER